MRLSINKLINLFRQNPSLAKDVRSLIYKYRDRLISKGYRKIKIMNFCGTHEWTTVHYGIRHLLPNEIDLVAGPGCPVCITPSKYIEEAIRLSFEGVRIYVFGDAYKLPSVEKIDGATSLSDAKALGGDVVIVYSFLDAIKNFKEDNLREAIFLGIGFETTAPSYALPIYNEMIPEGLYILSILRLTPPAAEYALKSVYEKGLEGVNGIVAPGHVSTVIGAKPWDKISRKFGIPSVVSGFEPIDLLISIALLLKMIYHGEAYTEIEYKRVVKYDGNTQAQRLIREVFDVREAAWRGIGYIPDSGLDLKPIYLNFNAVERFDIKLPSKDEWRIDLHPACKCAEIVLGLKKPVECPLYLKVCTPENPIGPCMVSIEGTCSVWARFGEGDIARDIAKEIELGE